MTCEKLPLHQGPNLAVSKPILEMAAQLFDKLGFECAIDVRTSDKSLNF